MRTIILFWLICCHLALFAQIDAKLLIAIQNNDLPNVKKCLRNNRLAINGHDENGATPLMWAVYKGDLAMVRYLVDTCGAGTNLRPKGVIYLDPAKQSYYGNIPAIAAGEDRPDMLRYFFEEKGWDWMKDDKEYNATTDRRDGWTPLEWACSQGSLKSFALLMRSGADININNGECLRYAYFGGKHELAYWLMESGIRVDLRSNLVTNLMILAAIKSDQLMTLYLLERGANINCWVDHPVFNPLFYALKKEMRGFIPKNDQRYKDISMDSLNNLLNRFHSDSIFSLSERAYRNFLILQGARLPDFKFLPDTIKQDGEVKRIYNYLQKTYKDRQKSKNEYYNSKGSSVSYDTDFESVIYFLSQTDEKDNKTHTDVFELDVKKFYGYWRFGKVDTAMVILEKLMMDISKSKFSDALLYSEKASRLGQIYGVTGQYQKSAAWYKKSIDAVKGHFKMSSDTLFPKEQAWRERLGGMYYAYSEILAFLGDYSQAAKYYFNYLASINWENDSNDDQHLKLLAIADGIDALLPAIVRTTNIFLKDTTNFGEIFSQSGRFQEDAILVTGSGDLGDDNVIYNAAMAFNKDTLHSLALSYAWLEKAKTIRVLQRLLYNNKGLFEEDFFQKLSVQNKFRLNNKLNLNYDKVSELNSLSTEMGLRILFNDKQIGRLFPNAVIKPSVMKSSLKEGECIVEMVSFNKPFSNKIQIAALVLPNDKKHPHFIPLCTLTEFNELFKKGTNNLYIQNSGLYDLIWKPIDSLLSGVKTIYLSPAGPLYRLNIPAIVGPDGQSLFKRFDIVTLGNTRVLAEGFKDQKEKYPGSIVIFGNMDYEKKPAISSCTCEPAPECHVTKAITESPILGAYEGTKGRQISSWDALNGSRDGQIVSNTTLKNGLKVFYYRDSLSSEENFKALGEMYCEGVMRPDVLYISTHGYAAPWPPQPGKSKSRYYELQDPMYRSGLIMSGANKAWRPGGTPFPEREDGVLLAEEIAQMDLRGVKLVVLSACETGLGDLSDNEGVFGLIRAFKLAGVEKVIVSLWQVGQGDADEFMGRFFEHWLQDKDISTVRSAFMKTQAEMQNDQSKTPRSCGAFILIE